MLVQWAILATTRQGLEHSSPGSGRPPTSPAHTLGTVRQRMSGWKVDLLLPAGGWARVLGTMWPPRQRLPPNAQAPEQPGPDTLGELGHHLPAAHPGACGQEERAEGALGASLGSQEAGNFSMVPPSQTPKDSLLFSIFLYGLST